MGMSASQARLIQLEARQSNLEYQGQQINQERTILSQQCTDLYNSLLAMTVPTPPSTQDYTVVKYSGVDGASNFNLGTIIPNGDNTYNIDLQYKKTGHYMNSAGTALVEEVPPYIYIKPVDDSSVSTTSAYQKPTEPAGEVANGTNIMAKENKSYALQNGEQFYELKQSADDKSSYFVPVDESDVKAGKVEDSKLYVKKTAQNEVKNPETGEITTRKNYDANSSYAIGSTTNFSYGGLYESQINNYLLQDTNGNLIQADVKHFDQLSDGTYKLKANSGYTLVEKTTKSEGTAVKNPDSTNPDVTHYVEGNACMSVASAKGALGSSYSSYIEGIRDAFPEMADKSDDEIAELFSVYFTKAEGSTTQVPNFVLTTDLTSNTKNVNGHSYVEHYNYAANGTFTSSEQKDKCLLTFDASGRITEVKVPTGYNTDGTPKSYKTIPLEATKVTDEAAYQDAYAKYEYSMYEYDKAQQEINAKTEIIQQEDRNLELKLQRLDNERAAIQKEIEAVDKVISDNIDKTFSTFSG